SLQAYKAGAAKSYDVESLYLWSVRWLNAERDLSKKSADQVAAAAAHLERMKTVETMAKQLAKLEQAAVRHAAAAEFYRVEAQIWLSQAKKESGDKDKELKEKRLALLVKIDESYSAALKAG